MFRVVALCVWQEGEDMNLDYDDRDQAFRDEVRKFLRTSLPDDIGFIRARGPVMIQEVHGFPLLDGYRRPTISDTEALMTGVSRLSQFARANRSTIESIEINPLLPSGQCAIALDAVVETRNIGSWAPLA